MATKFKCPHCKREVEITDAIRLEVEEKIKLEFESKSSLEVEDLKKALLEKEQKVEEMREMELSLREEKRKLEDAKKDIALEFQRKFDDEKNRMEEAILKKAFEDHRMQDKEKDKKINDLMQALEEAKRKAQIGSQQLQGEVLELDLEENLRNIFPQDTIEPVGKGVRGADIRQIVKSPRGTTCGVILWESKRTKVWTDEWASKLKEDLRSEKADIPVIVTTALPKGMSSGLGQYDGVWVVKYELALILAELLRKNILDVARQKAASLQKADKASLIYDYVMGHEFRQQIESLAETYNEMHIQIQKERAAFEKIWKAREAQTKRLMLSTANIYGSMQGLVGASMPQIKGIDLLEEGN